MIHCSRGLLCSFLASALIILGGLQARAQSWLRGPNLQRPHFLTTSTVLQDGRVLIMGGMQGDNSFGESCEIYDPVTNTMRPAAPMKVKRAWHSAVMLRNGKVLVIGGYTGRTIAECELYNPATDSWSLTGAMNNSRSRTTATLLPNGRVLVAGGYSSDAGSIQISRSCEIYDPATGVWTTVNQMEEPRSSHAAVLLNTGKVLVVSGYPYSNTCELFDPATRGWQRTGSLRSVFPTGEHGLTMLADGRVLLTGGWGGTLGMTGRCEIYDPATGGWSAVASLATPRAAHRTILLPNGEVIAIGGHNAIRSGDDGSCYSVASCEIYSPTLNTWRSGPQIPLEPSYFIANLLPSGQIFIGGGGKRVVGKLAEIYHTSTFILDPHPAGAINVLSPGAGHSRPSLTLLPNGNVLLLGGGDDCSAASSSRIDLYDSRTDRWRRGADIPAGRQGHTASLLFNHVLVAGGMSGVTPDNTTALYDFLNNNWTAGANMGTARSGHTASLMRNGTVLVTGGLSGGTAGSTVATNTCEVYSVPRRAWTPISPMLTPRHAHTATLLPDGKILVVGGHGSLTSHLDSCELYDPFCDLWTPTAPLGTGRAFHTATLLGDGRVLVAGGEGEHGVVREAEIYDYRTERWQPAGMLAEGRMHHTATHIRNGNVIVVGGTGADGEPITGIETYRFVANDWAAAGVVLPETRSFHAALLLPSNTMLIAGGITQQSGNCSAPTTAYRFDPSDSYRDADRPVIATMSPRNVSASGDAKLVITLTGTGFRDDNNRKGTEAGTGDYNSTPVNYPIVQLRRIGGDRFDNDFTAYLPFNVDKASWSSNGTQVVFNIEGSGTRRFPTGWYAVSVIANGIPSLPMVLHLDYTDQQEKPKTIFSPPTISCATYSFQAENPCLIRAIRLAEERSENVRISTSSSPPGERITVTVSLIDRSRPGKFAVSVNDTDQIEGNLMAATASATASSTTKECGVYSVVVSNPCAIDSLWLAWNQNVKMTVEESLPATSTRVTIRVVDPGKPGEFALMADGIPMAVDTIASGATLVSEPEIDCASYSFIASNPCGLDSITLRELASSNVTVSLDRTLPATETRVTVRLIDGESDGSFIIDLNGAQQVSGSLRGISSIAVIPPPALDTLRQMPNHCDSIVIRNTGTKLPMVLDRAWLGRNLEFSVPPSQLPMTIPPGEERSLFVCFNSPFSSVAIDTLYVSDGCHDFRMPLAARGGTSITATGIDDCGSTLQLQSAKLTKPLLRTLYPSVENGGSRVRMEFELYLPSAMAVLPLQGTLYDALGVPVKGARLLVASSRTEDGTVIEKGTLEVDTDDCAQGYYILSLSSPAQTASYPVVIVR